MAHEKERKLLFDYRDFINDLYNGRWLTEAEKHTYLEHVEKFLSTLPDEKEESGWISVDKELPPSGNCVLLYSETGGVAEGA